MVVWIWLGFVKLFLPGFHDGRTKRSKQALVLPLFLCQVMFGLLKNFSQRVPSTTASRAFSISSPRAGGSSRIVVSTANKRSRSMTRENVLEQLNAFNQTFDKFGRILSASTHSKLEGSLDKTSPLSFSQRTPRKIGVDGVLLCILLLRKPRRQWMPSPLSLKVLDL